MSEPAPIPVPDENARLKWITYNLQVVFHPDIKLTRRTGLEFAARISDFVEPEDIQLEGTQWKVLGGSICEGMQIVISKNSISVISTYPSNGLEWYEDRFSQVLTSFASTFEPHVSLRSQVFVQALLPLPEGADARSYLAGYVMLMHPKRFEAIDRPLQILGFRFYFPPWEEKHVDWGVSVRVESALESIEKVFLEAQASWDRGEPWDKDFAENSVKKLKTVADFMSDKLLRFLREPDSENADDS